MYVEIYGEMGGYLSEISIIIENEINISLIELKFLGDSYYIFFLPFPMIFSTIYLRLQKVILANLSNKKKILLSFQWLFKI